jgi:endonuclease-3 related protein
MNKRIVHGYEILFERFGRQYWWPGDSPWEICTGAVLTQNTNWSNVEKAITLIKSVDVLSPEKIVALPVPELEELIRHSGFFRIKTQRLRNMAAWWLDNVSDSKLKSGSLVEWRHRLLEINGIGQETADSILLYCFKQPIFVIDAYTKRIAARHFGTKPDISYQELQRLFMDSLPCSPELFNEYHALLVRNAKECCRKNVCLPGCPLKRVG